MDELGDSTGLTGNEWKLIYEAVDYLVALGLIECRWKTSLPEWAGSGRPILLQFTPAHKIIEGGRIILELEDGRE